MSQLHVDINPVIIVAPIIAKKWWCLTLLIGIFPRKNKLKNRKFPEVWIFVNYTAQDYEIKIIEYLINIHDYIELYWISKSF